MTGVAAHGAWPSPLRPSDLADAGVRMGGLFVHGDATFWLEGRAAEGGRSVLVRRSADGAVTDVTVADHNVRTLVHEYGGGDLAVVGDDVVYANFADQRLYRQSLAGGEPVAVTAEPASPRSVRYADARPSPDGAWLYAVRERHLDDGDVVNDVVAISLDDGTTVEVIARGGDFYAAPRPSPDGRRLAYLTWDHPQMPWDGTELRLVDLDGGSATGDRALIGGIDEAVQQPTWTDDGRLLAVTDRSGWWALHDVDLAAGGSTARHHHDLDFGGPMWQFGLQTFAPRSDGSTVVTWSEDGREHLGVLAADGGLHRSGCPFTTYGRPVPLADGRVATVAASTSVPLAAVVVDPVDGSVEVLHAPSPAPDPTWVSVPEHVSFPTTGDRTAGIGNST